jgi:hypothetical protein
MFGALTMANKKIYTCTKELPVKKLGITKAFLDFSTFSFVWESEAIFINP